MAANQGNLNVRIEDLALEHRHLRAADKVGRRALETVRLTYGGLAFHNHVHAGNVLEGTKAMARALDISMLGQVTAEVAALAHDIVQLKPRGVMERESADWLARQLHRRFPKPAVEAGRLAILGTEPLFDESGKLTGQMAGQLEYPSREAELIGLSVACADIGGELFSPYGPMRSHLLYKESQGVHGDRQEPSLNGLERYQVENVAFAAGYRFPHPMGSTVLGGLRDQVLRYQEQLTERLQAGQIESWADVLASDAVFARTCA